MIDQRGGDVVLPESGTRSPAVMSGISQGSR